MHIFCRLSVYIVQIMFLNELYYNKFYHLLVYFLTCCLCSNFNNFISCFKGISGSIFLSTPKAAVRSAVYMLSAMHLLSPSVVLVVVQTFDICIHKLNLFFHLRWSKFILHMNSTSRVRNIKYTYTYIYIFIYKCVYKQHTIFIYI